MAFAHKKTENAAILTIAPLIVTQYRWPCGLRRDSALGLLHYPFVSEKKGLNTGYYSVMWPADEVMEDSAGAHKKQIKSRVFNASVVRLGIRPHSHSLCICSRSYLGR